ncbi:dual specificity protein phosphatase [Acrasis kona]|uniref:protein-tyrosine-phosphatase n=1 Tax=Acrasis kona TaxID=1008807 RepID=A0AAW2Z750_9EUKA
MSIANPTEPKPRVPIVFEKIDSKKLYNILQEIGVVKLVFDLRSPEAYEKSHARTAQHLHVENEFIDVAEHQNNFAHEVSKHIEAVFPNKDLKRRALVFRYIVTYGSASHRDDFYMDTLAKWIKMEQLRTLTAHNNRLPIVEKFYIVKDSYSTFEKRYPFLCSTKEKGPAYGKPYPSEIVSDFLYLGDRENSQTLSQLKDCKINYILNMAQELPNKFEDTPEDPEYQINYLKLGTGDTIFDVIHPLFEKAVQFIDKARSNGGRVLIHCSMGVSRSATVTAAYLMRTDKLDVDEAIEIIKKERSIINPNESFRAQLKEHTNAIHNIILE